MNTHDDYKTEVNRILKHFGANVRELRTAREGISQEQLADLTGLHRTEIGRIELGVVEPRLITLLIVARYLRATPNDLVDGLWIPTNRKPRPEAFS
jgi:transcriptional regulator with XRE-family HTH domain